MTAETGCGRSVLERVSRPGRPGADYEVLLGEVARLRGVVTDLRDRLCVIGSPNRLTYATYRQTFALVDEARDFARAALAIDAVNCAPVESAARAVAPWCADHVRESEESRQPREEKPLNYWRGRCGLPMLDPVGPDTPRCFLAQGHPGPHLAECSAQQAAALDVKVEAGSLQPKDGAA